MMNIMMIITTTMTTTSTRTTGKTNKIIYCTHPKGKVTINFLLVFATRTRWGVGWGEFQPTTKYFVVLI